VGLQYFDEFAETERIVLKSVVPGAYLVDMIPQCKAVFILEDN
jgi:hypothetical protein